MTRVRALTAAAAVILAACATTPETIPELEQARSRVESLASNPQASQIASRELTAARAALARAEQAHADGEEAGEVIHLAYLAERRAELGLSRIAEATARERISKAEAERNKALLAARSAELNAARAEAQASRQAALQARSELESLQQQFAVLEAEKTDRGMVLTLGDVLFDTDQATLKPGAEQTIARLAEFLVRNEGTKIRIEGHTDSTGSEDYNSELSRRRAQAVADALAVHAISPARAVVVGRGEGFPVATNATVAGRQQNRRVEVVFSDPEGQFVSSPEATAATQPPD